ncbi:P-loop containing nucleoside triphosphate hydrolase protein [Basidiobolus meristosporus CBS 931.73]|uniref:p-loop containing nucleoside triphosphate hydrolase protein n=1 Tax=Basidiobolus meristosporus CBS 931.73 TaxID=1314790 RepID=A0A1Y1YC24_9FUNG|nr:P-loop containing nucleoside triphosphate hydrolase protein [Basidiobolus meristosporus CBS 931.73]|eukprot:ORX95493.1 P-loop containing nucleoside triphosphate hydrolase protein [Basidiobolus meristosporus CBS 931.73]
MTTLTNYSCSKETKATIHSVSYLSLYRFATPLDQLYILLAIICSITTGVGQSLIAIAFGNITTDLSSMDAGTQVLSSVRFFFILGLIIFVAAYGQMYFWTLSAENQGKLIRERYLHAVLRQDMAWHDGGSALTDGDDSNPGKKQADSLTTHLCADTQVIFEGMAEKVGIVISNSVTFLSGYVISFTRGWRLALVLLSLLPFMIGKYISTSAEEHDAYSAAGGVAEQAFSSIRTVFVFNGQKREYDAYVKHLKSAYRSGMKKAILNGLGFGFIMFLVFAPDSLSFWYGAKLISSGEMTSEDVMTVFMGITVGAYALWEVAPNVGIFASAQGAAYHIFKTIDRAPDIDSSSSEGDKPENVQGQITIQNVDFTYPVRPGVQVLKNISMCIQPGQTVALVGHSGSGKSTIVELIQRLYDPAAGSISVDNVDLRTYNVSFLRDMIGIVSQEPVLFNITIRENIALGIRKGQAPPTDQEIENTCRLANAHNFIEKLPMKYDTVVGEKGIFLSGGQKQRIAIARALIKEPRILMLDEATSALDTESERIVQEALEKASAGRTTLVVAHRLSTIKNADLIYVMDKGVVLESGTHESLLELQGTYAELVAKQQLKTGSIDQDAFAASICTAPSSTKHSASIDDSKDSMPVDNCHISIASQSKPDPGSKSKSKSELSAKPHATTIEIEKIERDSRGQVAGRTQRALISRVAKYMRPDAGLVLIGVVLSGASGVIFPLFAKYFGQIWDLMTRPQDPGWNASINANALMTIIIALAAGLTMGGSTVIFDWIGERMALRMRSLSFEAILSQEAGFFDKEEHSIGSLTSHLATDAYQMHELVSQLARIIIQTVAMVALSLALAATTSWRITLVTLVGLPFLALAEYIEIGALTAIEEETQEAYEQSAKIACEAILNIRTVVGLAKESHFEAQYESATSVPHQYVRRKAYLGSAGFAMAQSIIYWIYAAGFYAGLRFVDAGVMEWSEIFTTMFYIVFLAMNLGQMAAQIPTYVKGKQSAIHIFDLLDKRTTIDALADGISFPSDKPPMGSVSLNEVDFHYPTRPDIDIFHGFGMEANPGQTLALVGPSGCGKSTVIALLERWYDVLRGQVTIDGYDLRDMHLSNIRSHMALVGQEPVLFDLTIGENIQYGIPDDRPFDHEMVVAAAQASNIHDFVTSLPDGYDTRVGDKGSQLSGGQKQRIAIARAIIRNPKILLLDEATSALDSESENLVQDALDRARAGRTTIVIAHRLSTIQDADKILVINNGQVIESGQHHELLALNGMYANLCMQQNLQVTH